jgi:membrane protease YdiL (CAAX protease family)
MMVRTFLAVAFAVSWALGLVVAFLPAGTSPVLRVAGTLLAVAFMFGPLLGTVVAQRRAGEQVLRPLGVFGKPNPWWLVAWVGPFAYGFLALAFSLLFPDVHWTPDLSGFWERLATMVPAEDLEAAKKELEGASPALFFVMLVVQPLVAGATINAVAAFGEELGWRGFLHKAWGHFGFWRMSWAIGAVWGIWHAPLILQGHNYPEHPVIGVALMVAWCMLLAPPLHFLRQKTGSVVAVAVAHGTLNASAGIPLIFISGGSDLTVGMTGVAGLLALLPINLAIWFFDKPKGD